MSDPHENADRLREKLLEQDRTLAGNLHRGHTRAWFKIRKRLESLAKEQDTARAQKETTDLVWLLNRTRLPSVLALVKTEIAEFAAHAARRIESGQRKAVETARKDAKSLTETAIAAAPETERGDAQEEADSEWREVDTTDLVGLGDDRALLRKRLLRMAPKIGRAIQKHLMRAIADKSDLRKVIPDIQKEVGSTLTSAHLAGRTETFRTYRESTRRTLAANGGLESRWRWTAEKQPHICAACLAMDGREFPAWVSLDGHPNCKCMMVPVVPGTPPAETGEQWFKSQPISIQQAIVGEEGQAALAAGEVEFSDFVGWKLDPDWGSMRYKQSLEDARRTADERRKARAKGRRYVSGANLNTLEAGESLDPLKLLKRQVRDMRHAIRQRHIRAGRSPELTDQDVIELGRMVARAAQARFHQYGIERQPDEDDVYKAPARMRDAGVKVIPEEVKRASEAVGRRRRERSMVLMDEVVKAIIPLGPDKHGEPKPNWHPRSKAEAIEAFEEANKFLPRRWLRASARLERRKDGARYPAWKQLLRGRIKAEVSYERGRYEDWTFPPRLTVSFRGVNPNDAEGKWAIFMSALHESAHRVEHAVPSVRAIIGQFYQRRTTGKSATTLREGVTKRPVKYFSDAFYDYYVGRFPILSKLSKRAKDAEPEILYHELLSMGLEGLMNPDWDLLHRDEEHAYLVLGLMVAR